MHYLITGTAGFIGFHLARRLLEEGHHVTGFDGMTPYYNLHLKEARHAALSQFPAFRPVIGMLEDQRLLEHAGNLCGCRGAGGDHPSRGPGGRALQPGKPQGLS
jgi:nucleoside-diphosphate-sugar epimerase